MKGTVERTYDHEMQREFVEYRMVINGTIGMAQEMEEVDLLRDRSLEARVTNLDGSKSQVMLQLERMAEELTVQESDGKRVLHLNAEKYRDLIESGEVYVRNGTYSLRVTMKS